MIRLIDVYEAMAQDHLPTQDAVTETESILYRLLQERPPEANISHSTMPTLEQHVSFVRSMPYKAWYLIQDWPATYEEAVFEEKRPTWVGTTYVSKAREIGIFIFVEHQRKGFATRAVRLLRERHTGPLLANVSPTNPRSILFFQKHGWRHIQNVYRLD